MDARLALISIVIENSESAQAINDILHQYGNHIVARMGFPYPKRNVSIISVIVDAPQDIISALSGKLGALKGVSSKTLYAPIKDTHDGCD